VTVVRELVEIIRCNICNAPDAQPYVLGRDEEDTRMVDLCSRHAKPIEEAYETGMAVVRSHRRKGSNSGDHETKSIPRRHQVIPIDVE
jgi:hypothetical protein